MWLNEEEVQKIVSSKLESTFKVGRVTQSHPSDNCYTVQTATGYFEARPSLTPMGGVLKGSGVAEIIQEGAKVLFYHDGGVGFIVGCVADPGISNLGSPPVTYTQVTSEEEKTSISDRVCYRGGNPPDLLPGDWVRYTPEGGVVALLRSGIAKIGSGPLSHLQFNPVDDLGRLVSRNLEVFTDFMEARSTNDEGETNFELFAAPNFFEALGADKVGEEIGVHSEEEGKLRHRTEPHDRMGKWRIHAFAGWLGDNLHLFISKRGSADRRSDESPPPGLTEIMLSHDGAVRVRSCRELVLEKVSRISVPKKIREANHNDVGDSKENGYAPSDHQVYPWDTEDIDGRRLQETEYHNHCVDHEEKRHFRDHSKDWNVLSEQTSERPTPAEDSPGGREEEDFEETYSLIHQRSDGSIYMEDTDGSCIDMSNQNISISCRNDVRIQAGRDLLLTSGRSTTVKSVDSVEVVSHDSNIRMKSQEDFFIGSESSLALDGYTNLSLNSRTGDVLVRSEREGVTIKSDLGDINLVSTQGNLKGRASKEISYISDTGAVTLHGGDSVQITSLGEMAMATGILSGEDLSMNSEERQTSGGLTDVTLSTDTNNVLNLNAEGFISLSGNQVVVGGEQVSLTGTGTASVGTGTVGLHCDGSGYVLSDSGGSGSAIVKGGLALSDVDDDPETGGNKNFLAPGPSVSFPIAKATLGEREAVKADIKEDDFANGRFRWDGETSRKDVTLYEYPWQHSTSGKIEFSSNLTDKEGDLRVSSSTDQDTPDWDISRPVSGNSQTETSNGFINQVGNIKESRVYEDGDYSWEEGVTPGQFKVVDLLPLPDGEAEGNVGRINKIPSEGEEKSFKGTLDKSISDDRLNLT